MTGYAKTQPPLKEATIAVLQAIIDKPGSSTADLASRTGMTRSTIDSRLLSLLGRDLVVREEYLPPGVAKEYQVRYWPVVREVPS